MFIDKVDFHNPTFIHPKKAHPSYPTGENSDKQNKKHKPKYKSNKPRRFHPNHNYFEQINISISKGYIKPASVPKQRPKKAKKCYSKTQNQYGKRIKVSRENSQKASKKVSSFKLSNQRYQDNKILRVDRKKLTKIKSKLKANIEQEGKKLTGRKEGSMVKPKKRFNSVKRQNLFKKLEKLKTKKNFQSKAKNERKKEKGALKSKREVVRKNTNKSMRSINPGDSASVKNNTKRRKKPKTNLKSKINKLCKDKYEEKKKVEIKKIKVKTNIKNKISSGRVIKLKKNKSKKQIVSLNKEKNQVELNSKKTKSSSNFMKKQKIKRKTTDLDKVKLVPVLQDSFMKVENPNTDLPKSIKRETKSNIIINRLKVDEPKKEPPKELEHILNARKINLELKYKADLLKTKNQKEIKRIQESYNEELLFINQIEESLKKPEKKSVIKENQNSSKLSGNNSFLLTKKTSKTIDLSFNDERSFKRRGSSVISDPDVINLKKDYMIPMIKSINEISINVNKSYCLFNQKNSVDKTILRIEKMKFIGKVDSFCDEIFNKIILKYCKSYIKKKNNLNRIFKRNEENNIEKEKRKKTEENKELQLAITIPTFERTANNILTTLLDRFDKQLLEQLNKSYGISNEQILERLLNRFPIDFSLYHEYTTNPIIKRTDFDSLISLSNKTKPFITAYNSFIYDCVNEALCSWRPFVHHYKPFPWQICATGIYQISIKPKDLRGVMAITQKKLKEWSMLLCGYYNDKEDSCLGDLGICGEEMLEGVRQDRLTKFINWEIIDSDDRWSRYDLEQLECSLDVSEEIWEYLIDDLVNDICYNFI